MDLKAAIIQASQEIGIDKIGFTSANNFADLKNSLEEQKSNGHTTGFEHPNIDERIYPELIFDQPKSIISIALAYPTRMQQRPERTTQRRGQFARASWGTDYHTILREKMTRLIAKIRELAAADATITFKPLVDTGELIDVAVAQRAGLGFIGKNGLLITPEFGSFVYLGEIITNLTLEPDQPAVNQCGECTKCLVNCPPQALLGDGRMDGTRCLSYQTQTKGYMPVEFRPLIRNVIYGCDICQLVCPFNKGKDFHFHAEMEPNPNDAHPVLQPLLTMTNAEFKARFSIMAGAWRGKKPLQRNAIIALANSLDRTAIPALMQVVEDDPRAMIRGTAVWSLGQLVEQANQPSFEWLQAQLAKETEADTRAEYTRVLNQWRAQLEN
ncbi:MAG: tRNA epoxyqueuosine(34) reductase QueG [Lactobacillaceae bacterium]|jgi:epoxyqueuosine reductase|nr:tRNA epoxyqueuosine(34) reductase QueG [Lactobacillaceae bacterium]